MLSFLFRLTFILFIFVQLVTVYSVHDLYKSASHVLDFDLNQPAEQDEEAITAPMIATVPNKPMFQAAGSDVTEHQSVKTPKTIRDKERNRMNNRRFIEKLRLRPESFAEYKVRNNQIAKLRFENLSKSAQEEFRLKEKVRYKEYMKFKRAQNPNFQKIDHRTELRKKIKDGNPTKEELRQYEELKAKERRRINERRKARKEMRNQKRHKSD